MIRHEHVGMNLPAGLGARLTQRLDETLAIRAATASLLGFEKGQSGMGDPLCQNTASNIKKSVPDFHVCDTLDAAPTIAISLAKNRWTSS